MNQEILKHLTAYNQENGWDFDSNDPAEILNTLQSGKEIFSEYKDEHRWWNDKFVVVEIDGMLIGYMYAHANRDESLKDIGWEFDPNTICRVECLEKTITTYEPINI